jgi:hypothetical protein
MATTRGIAPVIRQAIALLDNQCLRDTLDATYRSVQGRIATDTAERVFDRLTSSRWPVETLCRFLSGWRSTHGTALFVSGMIIRLHREARIAAGSSRSMLYEAAAEIGEVIPEDTGVDDTPHHELFAQFANQIVGDDQWQLERYTVPACEQFRSSLRKKRLSGPIESAILLTAASENWNTGEFTYLDPLARSWLIEVLGDSPATAGRATAYISHHAGETELRHFLHVLHAWDLYCRATGLTPDVLKAKSVLEEYLTGITTAFAELERLLIR